MKAYIVSDRNGDEGISSVIFAETRGKALAYAVYMDSWCDYGFTGLRAKRCKELDKYYRGEPEMDWFDEGDRIAMVREAGFRCSDDFGCMDGMACPAYDWCSLVKDAEE